MRIQDLAIQGKAARQMIVERSQQIIAEHRKNNPQSAMKQTVKYHLPHGGFTVLNPTKQWRSYVNGIYQMSALR